MRYLFTLCFLAITGVCTAGAWDIGAFDNDDAQDWIWELTESSDLDIVRASLANAANASGYLQAPEGAWALAAAEVVAALRGHANPNLPDEVRDWVADYQGTVDVKLVETARSAVANVGNVEISELAELWADAPGDFAAWRDSLDDLMSRLR